MSSQRILLVCLGNICRSPMAEGLLRDLARQRSLSITTDSAGTGSYHVGEAPDPRAQAEMRSQGHDISDLRARQFIRADYDRFDLLLAMDRNNLHDMLHLAPSEALAGKARLMLDWSTAHPGQDVPDPWFGGAEGFSHVYRLLQDAMNNLLDEFQGTR